MGEGLNWVNQPEGSQWCFRWEFHCGFSFGPISADDGFDGFILWTMLYSASAGFQLAKWQIHAGAHMESLRFGPILLCCSILGKCAVYECPLHSI